MAFATLIIIGAGLQSEPLAAVAAAPPVCPDTAADAAAARATAKQCGKQVEIASARTESSQTFAQPGGGYEYVATAAPTRVHRPDGSWVAADPTLVRRPDGSIAPVATTVDLSFSGGGTGPFVTAGNRGKGLALSWHGPLPAPMISGATLTYAEILPGVDLQVIARVDGFSENIVVKNADAARNPALRSLVFSTKTTGLSLSTAKDGSGALVANDANGRSVFHAAPPRMWAATTIPSDSGTRAPNQREFGEPTQRKVGLKVGSGTLTVIPDASLLAGSSFPITIDPTFTGDSSQGMTWAQVYKTFPDSSHYMDTDSEGLRVGHAQADSTDNYTPYTNRSFWSFPTPVGMDGSTVSSATFYATERYAWTCTKMHVDLWDTSPISSATTWNNQPVWYQPLDQSVTTGYGYSPGGCPNATEVHWDATIGAAADASSHWHQLTLGLQVPNENQENPSNWHKYIATSARLIIAYNSPANPPTDVAVNRAGQVYPCASGPAAPQINTSGGLTLQATLSDPDGDPVTAHWTVNNVALPDDPSQPSGQTQIKTLGPGTFCGTGTVTTWQVSAWDGSNLAATAGPVCQIVTANDGLGPPSLNSTDLKLVQDPQLPPAPPSTAVVGVPGTVTLVPPTGATIVGYKYGVGNSQVTPISYIPAAADGTAKLAVVPQVSGLAKNYLSFQAVDSAGNMSLPVRYVFKALAGASHNVLGDATGDGKADITVMSNVGGGNSMLWRWDATSSGMSAPALVQDPSAVYPNASTLTVQGDFDTDGLSDVAIFTQSGTNVLLTVQRSDRNLLLGSQTLLTIPYWYLSNMKLAAGDFTGDGKVDIEVKYNIGNAATQDVVIVNTATVGNPSFAAPAIWATNCSGCDDWNRAKIVAGDFTGDGKADVAEFYDYGAGETKIWMLDANSTGTAFVSGGMVWDSGQHWWTWSSSIFFVGDFNGDGKLDIGAQYADPYAYAVSYWVFTQTATGNFNWPGAWTAYGQSWNLNYNETEPVPGDFDGDGKTDLALVVHCCGTDQTRLWTLASTGTSFAAPVYRGAGALGLSSVGSINPVPGTHYHIVAASSGKCLEVPGGATGNAVYLDQQTCASGVAYQQFTITPVSGGYVWIQPAHVTGKCLQVASASTADGAQIGQFDCASFTPSMMFQLSYVGGNGSGTTMQIKPLHTLMCGNLTNNGLGDGALFYQAACSSATSEQYLLQLAS